jgi:hypothetical protein
MNYSKCKICGEYGWENHKCDPRWRVCTLDEYIEYIKAEEEGRTSWGSFEDIMLVHARNSKEAAEKWSEYDDQQSGDFFIASQGPVTVAVISADDPEPKIEYFDVSAEAIPHYTAVKAEVKDYADE